MPLYNPATAAAAHAASHEDGGGDEIDLTGLSGTPADLTSHLGDASDAHDASAIGVADAGGYFADSEVEAVTQSLGLTRSDGWTPAEETWTRTANTTFTVSGDLTAKFGKGTRIKVTDTTTKYFVVAGSSHAAGTTTVTITAGSDHVLAANPTVRWYSYAVNPQGYPNRFTWAPGYTGFSANPSGGLAQFFVIGNMCYLIHERASGTSNAATSTWTITGAPITADATSSWTFPCAVVDNGVVQTTPGAIFIVGTTVSVLKNMSGSVNWTNANAKNAVFTAYAYPF